MRDLFTLTIVIITICTPIWGTYALTFLEDKDLALGLGVINLTLGCLIWPMVGIQLGELLAPKSTFKRV